MASLLLADPTKSYFKLSLWREASVWAERISIGDIVYFKCNYIIILYKIIINPLS